MLGARAATEFDPGTGQTSDARYVPGNAGNTTAAATGWATVMGYTFSR